LEAQPVITCRAGRAVHPRGTCGRCPTRTARTAAGAGTRGIGRNSSSAARRRRRRCAPALSDRPPRRPARSPPIPPCAAPRQPSLPPPPPPLPPPLQLPSTVERGGERGEGERERLGTASGPDPWVQVRGRDGSESVPSVLVAGGILGPRRNLSPADLRRAQPETIANHAWLTIASSPTRSTQRRHKTAAGRAGGRGERRHRQSRPGQNGGGRGERGVLSGTAKGGC
jgi:hypothetical protein